MCDAALHSQAQYENGKAGILKWCQYILSCRVHDLDNALDGEGVVQFFTRRWPMLEVR
jgi:hypothetical protein